MSSYLSVICPHYLFNKNSQNVLTISLSQSLFNEGDPVNEGDHLVIKKLLSGLILDILFLIEFEIVGTDHNLRLLHNHTIEENEHFSKVILRTCAA